MPLIETGRLNLRMFRPDDLDDLAALLNDPDVMRYVGSGQPITREESALALESIIRHWHTHGFGRWAILDKETSDFIGFGGLRSLLGRAEVVYHLARAYWGQGLATEMARASLRFGFEELGFQQIVAIAKPENTASIHVMDKLGMRYEMHTTYYGIDVVQYVIGRNEFKVDCSAYVLRPD